MGMMIDNSVIVAENIMQYRKRGYSLEDSCVAGTTEMITPMLSSSLTTVAVFLPLVFMSGKQRRYDENDKQYRSRFVGKYKINPFVIPSGSSLLPEVCLCLRNVFLSPFLHDRDKHRQQCDARCIGREQPGGDRECLICKYCSGNTAHEHERQKDGNSGER
mgnify:CR=1 FL=1